MKLLIGSNNAHKVSEISAILCDKFEEIVTLEQANIACEPEENGKTFLENATIKAVAVAQLCDSRFAVLADDTGLCVDALGGEPGVQSARYAQTKNGGHDSAANRKKLLQNLAGEVNRSAHFETAVVLLYPDKKMICATGRVDGHILESERGENGFGYDSLFFCDELGKTFAEATAEEKNAVSHRGRALQHLLEKI